MLDIESGWLYRLYQDCYNVIRAISPDMAVGVADPASMVRHRDDSRLPREIQGWLRNATHLFYAFHYYGGYPGTAKTNVDNAMSMSAKWGAAAFMTETDSMEARDYCTNQGVGWTYWEYSGYCNVPNNASCSPGEPCAFGACIM